MSDPDLVRLCDIGQLISAGIVAVGVAGEFILGFMAKPAQKRITALAEHEAVEAKARLATAEYRLLELQGKVAPREISEEQRRILSQVRGKLKINFVVHGGMESQIFAMKLMGALVGDGVSTPLRYWQTEVVSPQPAGILIYVPGGEAKAGKDKLCKVLKEAKLYGGAIVSKPFQSLLLGPQELKDPGFPADEYVLYVAQKPL